ncbi:MAG: MATE family efflux transporter [Oscillospiraceae bacterium]
MGKDMTKGSPLRLILLFSLPLLIGNVFQQFYNMADTIIVGRTVGVDALAAVGSTGSISFLVLGFVIGTTSGFSVITAQRFGAGDQDGVRRSICTSIVLSASLTLILTTLSMSLAMPMLKLMNTPSDIIDGAYNYIIVIFGGIFASYFYNSLSGILRAIGDSRTPLMFLIVASVLNIILDFVFIRAFHMGVAGAGYATVLAQAVSGTLCLFYIAKHYPMLKMHREDWRFSWSFALKHLQVGIPMALQFSITAIGIMVLQSALNSFGSTVVAAYTAASKVEIIFTQPMATLGVTISTYAAQNLGAMQYGRIRRGMRISVLLSMAATALASFAVVVFGRFFVSLFIDTPTEQIYGYAQTYLNTIAIFFIALAFLNVFRYALQGIGSAAITMLAGAIELVMRCTACAVLPEKLGYQGVCLASPLAWIGAALPLIFIYIFKERRFPEDGVPLTHR